MTYSWAGRLPDDVAGVFARLPRILIADADRPLAERLAESLRREAAEPLIAGDGIDALNVARARKPDLVVLDLGLPIKHGWDVCRELRDDPRTRDIPIVITTARAEESDQLIGFALGADDVLFKPYSIKVLVARIQYQLRRRNAPADSVGQSFECQGVVIDHLRHAATFQGQTLRLTPTEFRLLDTLIRHPGRVFTRDELREAALGEEAATLANTINAHIKCLRRKLGPAADLIETVRSIGYRFREPLLVES